MPALALAWLAAAAFAVSPIVKQPTEIDWKVSGTLPQGTATHDYHLIHEDPASRGIVALVRFSKGYDLPAHAHSKDETILVLKGKLELTMEGKTSVLGPGAYAVVPADMPHALKVQGWSGCEFVITVAGPVDFKPAGAVPAKK